MAMFRKLPLLSSSNVKLGVDTITEPGLSFSPVYAYGIEITLAE